MTKIAGMGIYWKADENGMLPRRLPTVQYISDTLNVSPNYLSDMLRKLIGQSM